MAVALSASVQHHTVLLNLKSADPSYLLARPERSSTISSIASTSSSRTARALPPIPLSDQSQSSMAAAASASSRRPVAKPLEASATPSSYKTITRASAIPQEIGLSAKALQKITAHPQILSTLLTFLPWTDFISLTQTCHALHSIMDTQSLKDAVLTKYVDGYGGCLRMQNESRDPSTEVPVSLHDLDLLLISQHTPLHIYPTRALTALTWTRPGSADIAQAHKLTRLTQAHSRFVLLLQSLAHSSSLPLPLEPKPEVDPIIEDTSANANAGSQITGRDRSNITGSRSTSVRELTFPAPLSKDRPSLEDLPPPPPSKHHRYSTSPGPKGGTRLTRNERTPEWAANTAPSSLAHARVLPSRQPRSVSHTRSPSVVSARKRLSIFGGNSVAPPPPSQPRDLKQYSTSWRRSLVHASMTHNSKRTAHTMSASEGSDDEFGFRQPRRIFASENLNSSQSSVSSANGSGFISAGTGTSSPPFTCSERRSSPSPPPPHLPLTTSPHDLILATSRVRAPILRVYVPCSDLSEQPEFLDPDYFYTGGSSIQKCEEQLVESGLWSHLSTGDVVCNLGYIPPAGSSSEDSASEDIPSSARSRNKATGNDTRKWLVFNGSYLVLFSPPHDRLPIEDAITLPSPFYYDHIMSCGTVSKALPGSKCLRGGNLRMYLGRLPPPSSHDEPQMQLVSHVTSVPSPHSRGGYASVRKWAWTARVWRGGMSLSDAGMTGADDPSMPSAMGIGWEGEWVIEGAGTSEGRQYLLDCLRGVVMAPREWELIRAKSGGGRIWLKMLDSHVATRSYSALDLSQNRQL